MKQTARDTFVLRDVTLREFGQNVPTAALESFSTEHRLWLARQLVSAGITTFEVASTANPKVAPAMSSERLLPFLGALGRPEGVELVTLVPGRSGYQRYLELGLGPDGLGHSIGVFLSAMDEHNLANLRKTVSESLTELASFLPDARERHIRVIGYVSGAFGFVTRNGVKVDAPLDRIVELANRLAELGAVSITLSDLQGLAGPDETASLLDALVSGKDRCTVPIGYHPHHLDREAVLDNIEAAAGVGVRLFDASLGAVGGCVTGAPGNAPTEGVVARLSTLGLQSPLKAEVLQNLAREVEERIFRPVIDEVSDE